MKITEKWLNDNRACSEGRAWLASHKERDSIKVLKKLQAEKQWDWFRWTAARLMDRKQRVLWACACAELVLDIFEKKYPKDKRPREAINAARKWVIDPTEENRNASDASAYAAHAAAAAAHAAHAHAAAEEMRNKCAEEAYKILKARPAPQKKEEA
jgi:hypothetical protein